MSSTSGAGSAAVSAPLRGLLARDSLIVGAALAASAILAWVWLAGAQAAGMDAMPPPLSAYYLLPAFAMWAIMMVAMMVPSAAPMILIHARIDTAPSNRRSLHTLLFVLAYLLVWTAFSAAAALAQALLVNAGMVSQMALSVGSREVAAILLAAAAIYELTAAKRLCLDKCQSPLVFILRYWKPGAAGALRLGIAHGLFCLGCCWMLMLLLFVGGVMNLAWVGALGIIVLGEKLAPPRWHAERYVAAALGLGALALLVS